jgi:Secretion system C-terminal sorting domain
MKITFLISFIVLGLYFQSGSQVIPYTGGNGSGYQSGSTAISNCSQFLGGVADGAAYGFSPLNTCPQFFGGIADGATASLSALTVCPQFFGGTGDGYATDSTGCITILSIKLLSFYGEKELLRNILHWKAEDGFNVKEFEVEKSADGTNFTKTGTVPGNINNSFSYLFIDTRPFYDISFYRLRIIEKDGQVSYSKIIVLKRGSASPVIVYPNPGKGLITIYFHSGQMMNSSLLIYQADGRLALSKSLKIAVGENYIPLDIQHLPNGMYILRIDERANTAKIFIQK